MHQVRISFRTPRDLREGLLTEEREIWIRHFFYLAIFAAGFHSLQFLASVLLWSATNSAAVRERSRTLRSMTLSQSGAAVPAKQYGSSVKRQP